MLRRLVALFAACICCATAAVADTRFERTIVQPTSQEPIEVGIWSPGGRNRRLPLILISHGTGGDFRSHIDTAEALSAAGFVVAAITHPGDNWRDTSRTFAVWRRPRHLRLVLDYMLQQWPERHRLDADRIGAFGFSAGGFTVLVAAGGVPDLSAIADHCRANPHFFECGIASKAPPQLTGAVEWVQEPRLRAVVVAAPALGFTFRPEGLRGITAPIQLWRAENDRVLPHPFYVEPVRRSLRARPDYHLAAGAGHFDFLSPCSPEAAAQRPHLCSSAPGFDRAAFHAQMNAELIRFFKQHLGARRLPVSHGTGSHRRRTPRQAPR
jgi:predicted dienelactone hydrolase